MCIVSNEKYFASEELLQYITVEFYGGNFGHGPHHCYFALILKAYDWNESRQQS